MYLVMIVKELHNISCSKEAVVPVWRCQVEAAA